MSVTVDRLRAEHRSDALGIGVAAPRLSWIVRSDADGFAQRSYEILATDPGDDGFRQSHSVELSDSVLVPWPFDPLPSRARRRIAVRVVGRDGDSSPWSDPLDI